MNNNSIPGLSAAIRAYTSDKFKERSQGLEQIRDIFDNRDNVSRFQETASREGGAGWVAFFQCLFQVVVMEKKAVLKKAASAQADKRLSDAIGLVRKVAEKTYQLLSKKPFMALFTHMVTLLVYGGQIFPPAAIDYIKALKTILSYPPHLECLDQMNWRIVTGVCWASILGDPVRLSEDDEEDELEDENDMEVDRKPFDMTQGHSSHVRQKTLSNINGEIAGLLPILFSAPAALLLSPLPEKDSPYSSESSTGTNMLNKIHRFFQQYPNDNNAHLPVLRTLNLILAEMELNARNDTISGSLKLLPQVGNLWSTRKKDMREQVVIALRTMLPFVTHKVAAEYDKTGAARETLAKIMDHLPKEGQLRWGVAPLDLSVIRLKSRSRKGKEKETLNPFETSAMSAGFDFSHESALSWVIEELYAEICYYLYDTTHATQNLTPSTQASAKRRRIDNAISTLVANTETGSITSRILHVQVLTFFIDKYHDQLHSEAQRDLRRALLDLLDEEDPNLQSWALIAFSHLATIGDEPVATAIHSANGFAGSQVTSQTSDVQTPWTRVWAHATRKIATAALSRAACHTATCLLKAGLASTPKHISDIRTVLANIEIQGPPFPYDSICSFLCAAVTIARNDATLYQQKLEDRVLGWLLKWSVVDGAKGKTRIDQYSAADVYRLLCEVSGVTPLAMSDLEAEEVLPDCAIVDRLIEEHDTKPLRRLIIHAEFPSKTATSSTMADAKAGPAITLVSSAPNSIEGVQGRPGQVITFLTHSIESLSTDWPTAYDTALAPPERVRKALDLLVAASAYLVTLQSSGSHFDPTCIQAIIHLLAKIKPSLASSSHTIPGQHLMWAAFKPLSIVPSHRPAVWPILLNASPELSGIRKVLFGEDANNDKLEGDEESAIELQKLTWSEATLGAALRELLPLTEAALNGFTVTSAMGPSSFQPHQVAEDDFGEIKIAESETMPLSREAIECRRTTSYLMSRLVRYRLCGAIFTSPSGTAGRDLTIINAWLAAEGPRFIQLGLVVCNALQDGLLRLNMSAVDAVLETLEEMVGSYGYSRNEGLLEIALAFLGHSAWVWISPEASSSDLPERAIVLARFLLRKTRRGQIASWRVRLAMILFLDEYLDYDSTAKLWSTYREDDEMETDDNDFGPFAYMQTALVDIDARVRIRASTSAAAVFLLSEFPAEKHFNYYFQALSIQPGQTWHWDSFMNHLLWKLNCCIASVSLRATAMFHLYEIPPTSPNSHQHFQHGMHAVAQRLHLESIADLFKPYAVIICRSQLDSGQKTIMQPYRLYGFPTKAAFGSALLSLAGPIALTESDGFGMFKDACEASSTSITWAFKQFFPAAAAFAYAEAITTRGATPDAEDAVRNTFSRARSHVDKDIPNLITTRIDSIIAHLLILMDLESTSDIIRLQIYNANNANPDPDIFCKLIPIVCEADQVTVVRSVTAALNPSLSSASILSTHMYLLKRYPNANPAKIVFLAFDMLFRLLHGTFLAAEENRYLRCLALVITLFQEAACEPVILQTFLREVIALIDKTDYPDIVVNMLQWGCKQVLPGITQMHDMPAIVVQLGEARQRIGRKGEVAAATCVAIDNWLAKQIPLWTMQEPFRETLEFAMAFWPKEITSSLSGWNNQKFTDLSYIADTDAAKLFSSMTLCSGLAKSIGDDDRAANVDTFVKRIFWHLRPTLSKAGSTPDGIAGLLDLLSQVDGDIHAPSLNTVVELSQDRILQRYKDRLAKEPATLLRVVLITKVAELTHHNDYRIRSIAMEVLRKSYPAIVDLMGRKTVFGTTDPSATISLPPKPLLELLLPLDTPVTPSTASLDVLSSDESWVKRSLTTDIWASQLAILLCNVLSTDDAFYSVFIPLLEPQAGCASTMLPWLVQSLLTCGSAKSKLVAEARSPLLSRYFSQIMLWKSASVGSVEIIIRIVLHLRGFLPAFRTDVLAFDHWLEIDPILLSEAAIKCGAFASALMFLEMKHDEDTQKLDLLDPRVQNIMYEIYSNVEDPDGFYGIQNHDVKNALLRRLQHEKQSWRAFGLNGAAFETGSNRRTANSSALSMMSNLHDMGFDHLSSGLYKATSTSQKGEAADDPLLLELAWRTGDWDLPVSPQAAQTPHGSFYSCLRAVHRQRDPQAARGLIDVAIQSEIGRLADLGLERMAQIKDSTANLVCLREISLWLDDGTQKALSEGDHSNKALERLESLSDTMDFPVAERVSATRLSLLRAAHARESKFLIGDLTTRQTETIVSLQKSVYLQLGRLARKDDKLQAAVNSITAVQNLEGGDMMSDEANDEFGHVLWDQKEHALAIQHVEQMTRLVESTTKSNGRLAVLLARNAHWTSVAKMRAPQEINSTFDRAYNMTRASKLGPAEQARVCHEYALFADNHLQALSKSPELDRLRQNRQRAHSELEHIETLSKSSKSKTASARTDESRRQDFLEDERALQDLENELTVFAKTAMKMYASSLIHSDDFDDSVTRLCSMWLEHDGSDDVVRSFSGPVQAIPSYKFIFLGPQLAARLYKPKHPTIFNSALNALMIRMSKDHPFHVLYQVITVAQGADGPQEKSTSKSRRTSEAATGDGRVLAAQEVLAILNSDKDRILARETVDRMMQFINAAVPWCRHETDKKTSRSDFQMTKGTPLLSLSNLKIPPPSVVPPVDLTKRYEAIATITRYRSTFKVLGGLHRPKRMTCVDSRGQNHYELFKGDDELRQDAVMEQVFEMTNRILSRDRKTKARDLRFRRYTVIPLPNRSGVMEFVGDSQAIGEYLKPAHTKYRAEIDHAPDHLRKRLEELQAKDHTSPELTKRYTELMKKFKPVMRHYFTEKHREPMAWFSMRLNYTRSVAVTSIVGHILGIGDRHCSNILIDKMTGELVHIDFGIVFEDGRRLRIPEKVPFRLTNDIVDGLGLTGVDGTFRQCSEHTLRVLRTSSDLILTVLEVFKHDPLYAWAADTEKLKRAQGGGRVEGQSSGATEKADRVLSKIRQKLRPDLSVEYTVNQLIQEARDPENLAKIFVGWQPWL